MKVEKKNKKNCFFSLNHQVVSSILYFQTFFIIFFIYFLF